HLFFDHLDDVGGDYIDKNRLNGGLGGLAAEMSDGSTRLEEIQPYQTYDSPWGPAYEVIPGYGHDTGEGVGKNNIGHGDDNDIYVVTSIQLTYVFGARNFKRAKFR